MDLKFKIEGIEIKTGEADVKLGQISYSIEKLDLKEYLCVLKETPKLVRELGTAIAESMTELHASYSAIQAEEMKDSVEEAFKNGLKTGAKAHREADALASFVLSKIHHNKETDGNKEQCDGCHAEKSL